MRSRSFIGRWAAAFAMSGRSRCSRSSQSPRRPPRHAAAPRRRWPITRDLLRGRPPPTLPGPSECSALNSGSGAPALAERPGHASRLTSRRLEFRAVRPTPSPTRAESCARARGPAARDARRRTGRARRALDPVDRVGEACIWSTSTGRARTKSLSAACGRLRPARCSTRGRHGGCRSRHRVRARCSVSRRR